MKIGENSKGQQLDLNNRLAQYLPVFLNSQTKPGRIVCRTFLEFGFGEKHRVFRNFLILIVDPDQEVSLGTQS